MNKIKINKPCVEKWENMQNFSDGKFCEKCSQKVWDFTNKTSKEVISIIEKDKAICGRISLQPFSKIATGVFIVTNLTFTKAQIQGYYNILTEKTETSIIKLSGKLIFERNKKEISDAEIFFITKSNYIKTTTDENGNFTLDIPKEFIDRKNVLYFNFDKINDVIRKNLMNALSNRLEEDTYENKFVIFSKTQNFYNQEFSIESEKFYIGAVVISSDQPPDYYYINGKSISEIKFEKLKNENPNYQYFIFDDKIAEVISKKNYLNYLHLLYSE